MSPKKESAAGATKKQRKSKLDRINGQFTKFRERARSVHALLVAAAASSPPGDLKEKIEAAAICADQAVAACYETSEKLLVLHKMKWSPKIGGRNVFGAGSLVMVKPRHADKHAAFFDKADLASLRVIEVKGKSARVEIFRDNLAGEKLVIPTWQLQAREAPASK